MGEAKGTSRFLTKDFLLLCEADNIFLSLSWTASYLDTHEEDDIIFQDEADFEKVTFLRFLLLIMIKNIKCSEYTLLNNCVLFLYFIKKQRIAKVIS